MIDDNIISHKNSYQLKKEKKIKNSPLLLLNQVPVHVQVSRKQSLRGKNKSDCKKEKKDTKSSLFIEQERLLYYVKIIVCRGKYKKWLMHVRAGERGTVFKTNFDSCYENIVYFL